MTINVDFSDLSPKIHRPELLQHPQIPAALAGMNPRTILGADWWNMTRSEAYRANNYNCFACANNPSDLPLEAHETYDIQWKEAKATYIETVALCSMCHRFIHAGRYRSMVEAGERDLDDLIAILKHGREVLQRRVPYWRTLVLILVHLEGTVEHDAIVRCRELGIIDNYDAMPPPDSYWRLVVFGQTYRRNNDGKSIRV